MICKSMCCFNCQRLDLAHSCQIPCVVRTCPSSMGCRFHNWLASARFGACSIHHDTLQMARKLTLLRLADNLAAARGAFAGAVREPRDAAVDGGQALLACAALRLAALRFARAVLALCAAQRHLMLASAGHIFAAVIFASSTFSPEAAAGLVSAAFTCACHHDNGNRLRPTDKTDISMGQQHLGVASQEELIALLIEHCCCAL